jgi:quercetin dioxygenase-like cupin family protein
MKKIQSLSLFTTGLALGLVPLLFSAQGETARPQPAKISGKTLIAASDMKWAPMPGLEGAQQVPLWGDPTKEAHRILYKWPAGTKAPLHSHTSGDRGLIVSGTLSLAVEGAAPKMLPAGSYFSLAGGVKHVTAVEGDAPCVFYVEREGAFDAIMAEPASAPKK